MPTRCQTTLTAAPWHLPPGHVRPLPVPMPSIRRQPLLAAHSTWSCARSLLVAKRCAQTLLEAFR
eukprot:1127436-Alexandrium_andersonii.AAC.1